MKHLIHLLIFTLMSTQAAAQELKPVAYASLLIAMHLTLRRLRSVEA